MNLLLPSETIFHTIETTIKEYRKFAQQKVSAEIKDITIDQSLALIYLAKFPDLNQKQLAELLFKDNASLTRILNLMVKKCFLKRSMNLKDRRRFILEVTPKGLEVIDKILPIVATNRSTSLFGISEKEINQLTVILSKIKSNCK